MFFSLSFPLFPLIFGIHQVSFLGYSAFPSLSRFLFRIFVQIAETIVGEVAVCHWAVSLSRWCPVFCAVTLLENLNSESGRYGLMWQGHQALALKYMACLGVLRKKLDWLFENRNCMYSV